MQASPSLSSDSSWTAYPQELLPKHLHPRSWLSMNPPGQSFLFRSADRVQLSPIRSVLPRISEQITGSPLAIASSIARGSPPERMEKEDIRSSKDLQHIFPVSQNDIYDLQFQACPPTHEDARSILHVRTKADAAFHMHYDAAHPSFWQASGTEPPDSSLGIISPDVRSTT